MDGKYCFIHSFGVMVEEKEIGFKYDTLSASSAKSAGHLKLSFTKF
jgi:hypothetical protein